jgi:hypothetical protein
VGSVKLHHFEVSFLSGKRNFKTKETAEVLNKKKDPTSDIKEMKEVKL